MMKRNKNFANKYLKYSLLLIAGIFLGWLLFHPGQKNADLQNSQTLIQDHAEEATIWTCAMHPQIRMDKPGKCPICGMDLISLSQSGSSTMDPDAVHLSREAIELANVVTTTVTKQRPVKEIRLYGKIQSDERLLQSLVAHVPGRIDKLAVNFTGERVQKGQVLAEIYSPELLTAQQELLETVKTKKLQPELYEASREKLRQWKLPDSQINELESSGKIMNNFKVLSDISGTVTARNVNTGDYVSQGTVLFQIADLSKVWVLFDAYETDLQFINKGRKINFTLQAFTGVEYSGTIAFIDPVIDPVTRVAKVRVETANKSGNLKPEMFATGIVSSNLENYGNNIVIPRSAILWTGKRSIVYVKQPGDESIFKIREVELGPSLGESFVITEGLSEGEEIVTSGAFSVDASAQLEGKPSMMNGTGGEVSKGHQKEMNPMVQSSNQGIISKDFKIQLGGVYDQYIILKNALVNSDAKAAGIAAGKISEALSAIDMKLLSGDAHNIWMDTSEKMKKAAGRIFSSVTIEEQRSSFSDLSDNLYLSVKKLGLSDKTAYYQFCPMYNNNKGAYWLSELNEIKNPYYGDQMLTCGETREVLKF